VGNLSASVPGSSDPLSRAPKLTPKKVPQRTPKQAPKQPSNRIGAAETRARIIDAARDTLRDDGITEASARTIARRGNFNQALIFYHFGSLEGLLIAVANDEGQSRADLYAEQFQRITKLSDLVRIARDVHAYELDKGGPTVLSQLLAGALSKESIAAGMVEAMRPWMSLVESAMGQTVAGTPIAGMLPKHELGFAVASLFIGMELLTSLDPESKEADKLFDVFANLASIADMFVANPSLVAGLLNPAK
jgi:AcrR family transcriptional regulator